MNILEYDKLNDNNEKYDFFFEYTSSLDYKSVTLDEIWKLLDISFSLFRYCFEKNMFQNSEYISGQCEKMLDYFLYTCDWEKICLNNEIVDFILDIICFVYELSYKYEQKAKILRKILDTEIIDKTLRQRALEEVKSMVSFSDLFTENDINSFIDNCDYIP